MSKRPKKLEKIALSGVLPQCNEIEEAVLGACLLDKNVFPIISKVLNQDDFYVNKHSIIFESMLKLDVKMIPIDLLTLTEEIRKNQKTEAIGGAYFLVELTNRVASSANIEFHARIVKQKAIERQVIRICQETAFEGFQNKTDSFELLDSLQSKLFEISKFLKRGRQLDKSTIAKSILEDAYNVDENPNAITGIPTGLIELDQLMNGIGQGEFIVIAARQKMGKTALAQSILANIIKYENDKVIKFYTFEDTQKKLTLKLACKIANLPHWKIGRTKLNPFEMQALEDALELINSSGIEIIEARGMDALSIRADMMAAANNTGLDVVFLDYFQRIPHMEMSRRKQSHDAFKDTSNLLADTAVEVCPIVCLAQLLKPTKGSEAARPLFSDMRGGSALMDDCHKAIMIYRQEYYHIMEDENGESTKGKAEIILTASRDYGMGMVKVGFEETTATFHNLKDDEDDDFANGGLPAIESRNENFQDLF